MVDHDDIDEIEPVGMREKVLSIVPHCTGFLSIIGSSIIAYESLNKSKDKRESITYHHLLFCLSVCDIVSSFALFLSTWPLPAGTANNSWDNDYHYGAIGNDATCVSQASGIQFGMVTVFYNVSLSMHYLLSIRYNVRTERMAKIYEPWLLLIPFFLALLLTIPGFILNIYGNTNLWCWIAPDFSKCTDTDRADCINRAYVYRWIFYFGPVWASIGIIGIAQILLFLTVRSVEKRASRWRGASIKGSIINADIKHSSVDQGGDDQDGETTATNGRGNKRSSKLCKQQQKLEEEIRRVSFQRTRRVAIQASFYFAAFVVCWMPYTLTSITGSMKKFYGPADNGFWLLLTIVTLQPLQGFLNCFIYYNLYSLPKLIDRLKSLCRCQ